MVRWISLPLFALVMASCAGSLATDPEVTAEGAAEGVLNEEEYVGPYELGQPYTVNGIRYVPVEDFNYDETGIASWYGGRFAGNRTANGERFDPSAMTAAHKTLPFSTLVRVTHVENRTSVVVRINDRGPFTEGRIIDLSEAAAREIGMIEEGTAEVRVQVLVDETRALISRLGPDGSASETNATTADATNTSDTTGEADSTTASTTTGTRDGTESASGNTADSSPSSPSNTSEVSGGFFVRTAPYGARTDAEALAGRLEPYGNVRILEEDEGHRVYIGPFASQVDAQRVMGVAIGEGARGVAIVQR